MQTKLPWLSLIAITSLGSVAPGVYAQKSTVKNSQQKTELKVLSPENREDSVIVEVFRQNAPQKFNVPGAPRFALIGNEHKYYMGIGGYVKGTASFDFKNPIDNPMYFTTSQIPMNQAKGNGGLYQMSAGTSNIFFNFIAMPQTKYQVGAYVNFNFAGNNYGFDLQYAYLTFAGFSMGYNFTMFADLAAAPPTIDQEGPSSMATVQNTLMNYTYTHKNWSFALGAELPMTSITTNSATTDVNQRAPAVPAYIQYKTKNGSSLRVTGLWRNMQYRNITEDKNKSANGWGVQLSGVVKTPVRLTMYYQGVYGQGISSFVQDMSGLGLDLVPDEKHAGDLITVKAWGAYMGLQYNFTKNLFCSHTYSQVRNYAKDYSDGTTAWDDQYRYAQYIVNNIFWSITPSVQVGAEYIWGRKAIMDGRKCADNRIQAMFQFSF